MGKNGKKIYILSFLGIFLLLIGLLAFSQLLINKTDVLANLIAYSLSSIAIILGVTIIAYVFGD